MRNSLSRKLLNSLNRLLAAGNLKLDSLTLSRIEAARLQAAAARGTFSTPVFPVPEAFVSERWREVVTEVGKHEARFASFEDPAANDVGYQFANGYYRSPDTEVLYSLVRLTKPARILELGCGNSTKIIRQALRDGGFPCHHTCIDPFPRLEITKLADEIIREPVERQNPEKLAARLQPGDLLFIDTSHEVKPANDVAFIYGAVLPRVAPGVIIHIHDIFLPYDYPQDWVIDEGLAWGEQYLVQAMLTSQPAWTALWAGHYLQKIQPDFTKWFPRSAGKRAQSLWILRKPSS